MAGGREIACVSLVFRFSFICLAFVLSFQLREAVRLPGVVICASRPPQQPHTARGSNVITPLLYDGGGNIRTTLESHYLGSHGRRLLRCWHNCHFYHQVLYLTLGQSLRAGNPEAGRS